MIKKGNKLLQVSVSVETVQVMDELCDTLGESLKIHLTKGQLITFLVNKFIKDAYKNEQEIQKIEKKEEN